MPAACVGACGGAEADEVEGVEAGGDSLDSCSSTSSSHRLSDIPSVESMITSCSWIGKTIDWA